MSKVNISIDDGLLKRVDDYAAENYTSRSGVFTMAANEFLSQRDYLLFVKKLSFALDKIAETNTLSEEDKKLLEDFQRYTKIFTK